MPKGLRERAGPQIIDRISYMRITRDECLSFTFEIHNSSFLKGVELVVTKQRTNLLKFITKFLQNAYHYFLLKTTFI